jgi:hypothetical protein
MNKFIQSAVAAFGAALLLSLTGCEGLFTGERESVHPLSVRENGSFAPVRLELAPAMNPLAFNLKGSTIAHYAESGRWNTYRAVLSLDGAPVATGRFNVNNRGTRKIEEGGEFATTMLFASVPREGEYELAIELIEPKAITVESPHLEVRRNTEPPPGNAVGTN